MPSPISDYAMVGDCETAALVSRTGSVDWLCWPRLDSHACFASLLGAEDNGHWLIAPQHPAEISRRYRPGTLVLESDWNAGDAMVRVIDFMPPHHAQSRLIRIVQGLSGRMAMRLRLVLRFDYGRTVPWVQALPDNAGIQAVAGPDQVVLHSPIPLEGGGLAVEAVFEVAAGSTYAFVLGWQSSHLPPPAPVHPLELLASTERYWLDWSGRFPGCGRWSEPVLRSLITLKALTYAPTGGIAAAATTSLPAVPGGVRNWDYRFCWIRDATLSLLTLMLAGYYDEAAAWRAWLVRAVAGRPEQLQIMYGIAGERWLDERTVPWLAGHLDSRPVRVGNAASDQFQLDVYGELMGALHQARMGALADHHAAWHLQSALLAHLETTWRQPDSGIWEMRAAPRHYTHSKVMAWVAFDRAIKSAEHFGLPAPIARWRAVRDEIHRDVCEHGFDAARGTFLQSYGNPALDASLLQIPLVGFLPPHDPRVQGTLAAVQHELCEDGFLHRYRIDQVDDGIEGREGVFLACSFWLADNLQQQGRRDEAIALFERLLALRNDVGLLSEAYDPRRRMMLGNFPQAFSHIGLIHTGLNLASDGDVAALRRQ